MEASNAQASNGCLKSLWKSLQTSSESGQDAVAASSSFVSSSLESSSQSVNWMIVNRGGFAKLTGLMMVPSQFLGPDLEGSQQIIDDACQNSQQYGLTVKTIDIKEKSGVLKAVICYPQGWDLSNRSRCTLFHNPNGIVTAEFFEEGRLSLTAGDVLNLKKCPIILYDYRGTGLNQSATCFSSLKFRATYETVVEDGLSALNYALEQFEQVDIWGSSLGGGVAAVSLERYLNRNPGDVQRVTITSHDSFTKTARVILPNHQRVADCLGWLVGGNLDAQTAMTHLVERNIKVMVLAHLQDPVIPSGARMYEYVSHQFSKKGNVSLICSPHLGHANLSFDQINELSQFQRKCPSSKSAASALRAQSGVTG